MATEVQIDAVIQLGADSIDSVDSTEAATFNAAYGEVYLNEPNDPYEVAMAKKNKA